jgi:hypothetical protein
MRRAGYRDSVNGQDRACLLYTISQFGLSTLDNVTICWERMLVDFVVRTVFLTAVLISTLLSCLSCSKASEFRQVAGYGDTVVSLALSNPKAFNGAECAALENGESRCWGYQHSLQAKDDSICSVAGNAIKCDANSEAYTADFVPEHFKVNGRALCAYASKPGQFSCWLRSDGSLIDPSLYKTADASIADLDLSTSDMVGSDNDIGALGSNGGCAVYDFQDHSEIRCWRTGDLVTVVNTLPGQPKIRSLGITSGSTLCYLIGTEMKCGSRFKVWTIFSDVKQIFDRERLSRSERRINSSDPRGLCALRVDNTIWCGGWNGNEPSFLQVASPWSFEGFKNFVTSGGALILSNTSVEIITSFRSFFNSQYNVGMTATDANSVSSEYNLTCLESASSKKCAFYFYNGSVQRNFEVPKTAKVVGGFDAYCLLSNGEVVCSSRGNYDQKVNFSDGIVSDLLMSDNLLCAKGSKHWTCMAAGHLSSGASAQLWTLPSETMQTIQPGVGENYFCGLLNDQPKCWISDVSSVEPLPSPVVQKAQKLSVGNENVCALVNGTATCWHAYNGARISLPSNWETGNSIRDISVSRNTAGSSDTVRNPFICALTDNGFGCSSLSFTQDWWYPFH